MVTIFFKYGHSMSCNIQKHIEKIKIKIKESGEYCMKTRPALHPFKKWNSSNLDKLHRCCFAGFVIGMYLEACQF